MLTVGYSRTVGYAVVSVAETNNDLRRGAEVDA